MSEIPDDRPLSPEEEALTRWLLEHGEPEATGYLADLAAARVVARCGCGCASVDFTVAGQRPPPRSGLRVLADYEWDDPEGRLAGVFAFAHAGQLAGLEVWAADPDADVTRLPRPEALRPLGAHAAERGVAPDKAARPSSASPAPRGPLCR